MGAQPASTSTVPVPATGITAADVAKHASEADCWTIISGKVYDVTSVIPSHPGGPDRIIAVCGKDGTSAFDTMNGRAQGNAMKQLASLLKGDLTQ
jgi:cytochrome b involved in lipid metabolism